MVKEFPCYSQLTYIGMNLFNRCPLNPGARPVVTLEGLKGDFQVHQAETFFEEHQAEVRNYVRAYREKLKPGQNPDDVHIEFLEKQPLRQFFEVSLLVPGPRSPTGKTPVRDEYFGWGRGASSVQTEHHTHKVLLPC